MSQDRLGFETEVEDSIARQIANLSAYYGLEEAVLRPILERTAEPRQAHGPIQVTIVYKPSLRAALARLQPDQALPLFHADGLSYLGWRESFTRYLHTSIPLYTLSELTRVMQSFGDHLDEHYSSILGVPYDVPFEASPWLSGYARLIYPFNDGYDDFCDLWAGILTTDDWEHIDTQREELLNAKTEVVRRLRDGLRAGLTGNDLADSCIERILASMSSAGLQAWIRIDRLTTKQDIATGSKLAPGERYISGGLSDVLEIIGHCAEETDVGIFAATANALGGLRHWDRGRLCVRAANYYDAVGQGYSEQIDGACDEFRRLRERHHDFWVNYRDRLIRDLRIEPYEPSPSVEAVTVTPVDLESFFEPPPVFEHSSGYVTGCINGYRFKLTPRQGRVIQLLHRCYEKGQPELSSSEIMEVIDYDYRMRDLFKSRREAYNHLVLRTDKGMYRLNL